MTTVGAAIQVWLTSRTSLLAAELAAGEEERGRDGQGAGDEGGQAARLERDPDRQGELADDHLTRSTPGDAGQRLEERPAGLAPELPDELLAARRGQEGDEGHGLAVAGRGDAGRVDGDDGVDVLELGRVLVDGLEAGEALQAVEGRGVGQRVGAPLGGDAQGLGHALARLEIGGLGLAAGQGPEVELAGVRPGLVAAADEGGAARLDAAEGLGGGRGAGDAGRDRRRGPTIMK